MYLIIYFCGTGDDGTNFCNNAYPLLGNHGAQVKTILVQGCEHREVCNNEYTPDLRQFTRRFVDKVFTHKNGRLYLSTNNFASLEVGIRTVDSIVRSRLFNHPLLKDRDKLFDIHALITAVSSLIGTNDPEMINKTSDYLAQLTDTQNNINFTTTRQRSQLAQFIINILKTSLIPNAADEAITEITFIGYSRGAVTTIEAARQLNTKQIRAKVLLTPVNVIADQPVSGNSSDLPGTIAAKASDYRLLDNLKSVSVILGALSPELSNLSFQDRLLHTGFFSQILPTFHSNVKTKIIVIPRIHHWSSSMSNGAHFILELAQVLKKVGLMSDNEVQQAFDDVSKSYKTLDYRKASMQLAYPPSSKLQRIFGVKDLDSLYHNIDSLHPAPYLRLGFDWEISVESLLTCWERNNQVRRPNRLTQQLIDLIRTTDTIIEKDIKNITSDLRMNWIVENSRPISFEAAKRIRLSYPSAVNALHRLHKASCEWLTKTSKDKNKDLVESMRGCLYFHLTNLAVEACELQTINIANPEPANPIEEANKARNYSRRFFISTPNNVDAIITEAYQKVLNTDHLSLSAKALIRSTKETSSLGSERDAYLQAYINFNDDNLSTEEQQFKTSLKSSLEATTPNPIKKTN